MISRLKKKWLALTLTIALGLVLTLGWYVSGYRFESPLIS